MPRRAQPIKLTVAENPDPKYPSLEACLRANIPLLCWLVTPHPPASDNTTAESEAERNGVKRGA